jgi:PQQ-dependent dehydrogenase (s-GDH family)
MRRTANLNFLLLLLLTFSNPYFISAQTETFTKRTVATGLNSAWEVVYGPNDSLWITENASYKISKISLGSAPTTTLIINLSSNASTFTTGTKPQGGLMGLAIHPNLYSSDASVRAAKPWVYVAFVYNKATPNSTCTNGVGGPATGCVFSTRIVRYDYNGTTLVNPVIVLDNMPGSSDHNSGRLVIGPTIESGSDAAHTQYRLYYTIGDMGSGQFANTNRPESAQVVDILQGKSLRINTESDGDAGADAWVPNDNPFYNAAAITPQDYVFTMGHRNPQGLAWGNVNGTNILYSSEQMDRSDDEVNILQAGKNYGWDKVSGFSDGNVNGFKIGQTTSANEQAFSTITPTYKDPIFQLFGCTSANMAALYANGNNAQWPTAAVSSIDFYGYNVIPGWPGSLLFSPLKKDVIYRVKLNANGDGVSGDTIPFFRGDGNRIRRIRTSPNGLKFYVARDAGATANGGAIVEYTYTGSVLAINENAPNPLVKNSMVRIYPNPATNFLNVEAKKEMRKPLKVQLYDLAGKVVKETTSYQNKFSVDVTSLHSGVYIFKMYNAFDVEMQTEKIIKL